LNDFIVTIAPRFYYILDYPVLRSFLKIKDGAYVYVTNQFQIFEIDLVKRTHKTISVPKGAKVEDILKSPSSPNHVRVFVRMARKMTDKVKDIDGIDSDFKEDPLLRFILDNLHAIKCITGNYLNVLTDLVEKILPHDKAAAEKLAAFDYRSVFFFLLRFLFYYLLIITYILSIYVFYLLNFFE
jgi:hypothetical protein